MKLIALLIGLFELINRGLDKLDEYDKRRKQLQRQERQASVQDDPDKAFADLFGESVNHELHQPINEQAVNNPVRPNLSTITVDKNGKGINNNA